MPSSPPTMTWRLPRCAPHTPPETGESSTCTPLSLKAACSFRIIVGEPVERSAKIVPVTAPWMIPLAPRATASTSFGPGSDVRISSLSRATSRGLSIHFAPSFRWGAAASRRTSLTMRLWPALMRLRAIGPPMFPSPMNPMRMTDLLDLCDCGDDLGAHQLDGAHRGGVVHARFLRLQQQVADAELALDQREALGHLVGRAGNDEVLGYELLVAHARERARTRLQRELLARARAHAHRREPLDGAAQRGAHAPDEMTAGLQRLGSGVRRDGADQEAEVVGRHGAARLRRPLSIELEQLARDVERHQERHVGVAALAHPHRGLRARGAGDPDRRVRLLQRQAPGGHVTEVIVPPLPAEG